MRVIDCHVHVFPTAATGWEWQALAGRPDGKRSGGIDELAGLMEEGGVDQAVMLLLPRSAERLERLVAGGVSSEEALQLVRDEIKTLNRWGCELASRDPRFIAFIGVDVRVMDATEIESEIVELRKLGAKGVKILPPMMKMYANDPLLTPVFAECERLGLPVLSQSGGRPGSDGPVWGEPRHFADVLDRFPRLNLILAHLGRGYEHQVVELASAYANLYTDTSLQLSGLGKPDRPTPDELVELFRKIGSDRVLLGSNYPYTNPAAYKSILMDLPMSSEERQLVAALNLQRLLPSS